MRLLGKVGLILALLFAPAIFGCASTPKHAALVADVTLYETLSAVHSAEQIALCGMPSCKDVANPPTVPGWTLAKSQAFNKKLLPATAAGLEFNTLLANWKPGTPLPDRARGLITGVTEALTNVLADFPDGESKLQIVASLGKAQTIALNTLTFVLTVKQ